MSKRFSQEQLQGVANVSDFALFAGKGRKAEVPRGLYAAAALFYLLVIGVTASLFIDRGLALSVMVLANLVVLVFGLAGHWAGAMPDYDAALPASCRSPGVVSML